MRIIRESVFESNSSSMHTVSVRGERDVRWTSINDNSVISVELDEYGWSGPTLYTFTEKLKYALSMVLHTEYPGFDVWNEDFTIDQETLESLSGYQILMDAIRKHMDCERIEIIKKVTEFYPYGYIDHQSCEDYGSLREFLDDWNVDAERFLFDGKVMVIIDNDNH